MSTKPIKQYATLTDEAGVAAVTVATGGGVTVNVTGGNIRSGTYTPSVSKSAGTPLIAAATVQEFQWLRVGNVVTLSGCVSVDTDIGGYIEIKFTLPEDGGANNFSTAQQGHGVASVHQINVVGSVFSIAGERTLYWGVILVDGSARNHTINATYTVI